MRIDLVASEDWERGGEALKSAVRLAADESLRVHAGLEPGVFELALGLAQIYSHKRAIAVVKGNSPAFDPVVPWFQKETYQVQTTTWSALPDEASMKTWIEGLKKETALVLAADDHPVTGALVPVDALEAMLAEKKIFLIRASHSAHLLKPRACAPYAAKIGSIGDGFAVSVSGARLRIPPLFSHRLPWDGDSLLARWKQRSAVSEDATAVETLESAFPDQRFFRDPVPRIFDRAVLTFAGVNGEAVVSRLAKKLSLSPEALETASLCRWNSTRLYKSWWENPPGDDALRGLVVISSELCRRKDFAKELRATYEELLALQTW